MIGKSAAPAPFDETVEYARFNRFFAPTALFFVTAVAYAASWFLQGHSASFDRYVSEYLPWLHGRFQFLGSISAFSQSSYVAVVFSGLFTVPILIAVNAMGYWKTVVVKHKRGGVGRNTIFAIGFALLVIVVMPWFFFVFVPEIHDPSYLGMARVFFWPVFPMLAGMVFLVVANVAFSVLVGILKFVLVFRGRNG